MRPSNIAFLIIVLTLNGCRYFQKKESHESKIIHEEIIDNNRTEIANYHFIYNDTLLIGKWCLELLWTETNGTWSCIKPHSFRKEFIFTKNKKFIETEYNEDSLINWTIRGEFERTKEKDSIRFAFNEKMDTVFVLGDTAKLITKRIHLLNDSILRIQEFHYQDYEKYKDIEEYRRQK